MSSVIPKERQTAYERWELASFGDPEPATTLAVEEDIAAQAKLAFDTLVAQRVNELREQAQQEGREAGYAAGFAEGHEAGLAAGRTESAAQGAALLQLAQSFGSEVAAANDIMADDMLTLALDLSKAMLKTALAVRPEIMLPVVGEAIRYLPSVQQPAIVYLHPQDAVLVKDYMADDLAKSGWRIADDAQQARGGCRVETASNQIDASVETRWQRIAEALGKQSDWLA
jgi:flagellar assembly protein FliH